ncbi:glycoside hydrolase family 3 N-terminal domain-containing protein [Dinghuibacter silviterrae]|uniref:Beta-glucosidase n=1 Tax=Dinghuibacter silviterrae TaxID=1539049 RepID=A0A4R8DVS6_9BACT|nr:glycoside hydrolase family 3 N-terminal domain-containing protein [Dinghuibacter silviterrae]TDX01311.1 beta-glucosidase [Dinghuibacter silviterrae]
MLLLWAGSCLPVHAQSYKDPSLPVGQRVKDLLSRMTVEEKVAQLRSTWSAHPRINEALLNNPRVMDSLFGQGIGMINPDFDNTPEQTVRFRNAINTYLRTKTRLGIPAIFLDEAHHGLLALRTDVFPTSIGLGCSWDTLLVQRVYDYVGRQVAGRGANMVLAPVVDVTRDPRWGRVGETFGEDPYLCGLMGSAVVRGFQGSSDGSIAPGHVATTLKHFTGHGQPEGGVNQGPADYPVRVLRTFHMEPFRLAIGRAHPAGIMAAYVEVDGVPCHANSWLLKDVLRKEWGFGGVVVSDWWGIDQLYQKHLVAPDRPEAARMAFEGGVTVDLPMGTNYARLAGVAPQDLDEAVGYVLALKFKLGLFDHSITLSMDDVNAAIGRPEGSALALKAAEESMVLLKNDNGLLPLASGRYKKIAVIGPCAATNYTGDYSGAPAHNVSLLDGIRHRYGQVSYAKGVDLSLNGDTLSLNNFQYIDTLVLPSHEHNYAMIDSAVAVAREADLVICAVGENEQFTREAEEPHHYGDASTLGLPSDQDSLVRALEATGKPVVLYLAHGRPRSIGAIAAGAGAVLDGWFTGEEAGDAAAAILFGDVNPSGKLTISIPRSVGQLPVYYNHKPSAQFMPYVTESNKPLYPFGYGLSYTTFRYSAPRLSSAAMSRNGSVQVSVDVTNAGAVPGDEVVQLYIHQKVSSVTRPVRELKDFSRIHLEPGQTQTVTFTVDATKLAYWNKDMHYAVDAGAFQIMVGASSVDWKEVDLRVD